MNILICSQCSKAIRKNQNGIYCNNSNHWLHVKCTNLTNEEFKLLCKQDDDIPWCRNHCILDVLPFRNVTNSEFLEQHQFCSKKNLTFQLDPNELSELFVDDSIQLSNVSDIDYHDFFDISYYFSENSENIIANMQTQSSSFLITMHLNIRSLPANFDKLQSLLANMKLKPHILSINETWLKNNQKGEFNNLSNYVFISNNRTHSRGGGVALYVDDTLSFSVRDDISIMKEKICETLFIDVHFNKQETVTIGTIYRSPLNNNISHSNFADSLTSLLKTVKSSKNHTIIMGDFNYNLLEFDNPHVNDFVQIMYEHKFYPTINKPTRITTNSATLIDHIWTDISHCKISSGILVDCIADHLPILQSVQLKSPPVKNTKTGKRHISSSNISKLVKKLEIYNFSGIFAFTDVDSAYEKFIQQFCTIFDERFPITPTISKKKRGESWYDSELKDTHKAKQQLYKKLMRNPSKTNKQNYNKIRNKYDRMIKTKKQLHIKIKLDQHRCNLRETWKIINDLLGKKKQQHNSAIRLNGSLERDNIRIANHFKNYFSSVADSLAKKSPKSSIPFTNYLTSSISSSIFLKPTSCQEIKNVISTLKPKLSNGADKIPLKIIKFIPENVLNLLAWIFNLSLQQGKFPEKFKIAKIIPIHKKGDPKDVNNYRPISLLSSFSKILEKIVHCRLSCFFKTQFL